MTERAFVTGSKGFIGGHLIPRLLIDDCDVCSYDRKDGYDVLNVAQLTAAMQEAHPTVVYHLAGLADVSRALAEPYTQAQQNCFATLNVLEAMRVAKVPRIVFTSTAVVYGDTIQPSEAPECIDEEGWMFPQQTSVYGAMKLASESLINAYCVGHGLRADIFRLVSLVGPGYRHGNLLDFYRRLSADPTQLTLKGSPQQQKYYCAVDDFIDAVRLVDTIKHPGCEIWNVSHDQPNTIEDSIKVVNACLNIDPLLIFDGDSWAGDLPALVLDTSKLRAHGWAPQVPIMDAMRRTVEDFMTKGL